MAEPINTTDRERRIAEIERELAGLRARAAELEQRWLRMYALAKAAQCGVRAENKPNRVEVGAPNG